MNGPDVLVVGLGPAGASAALAAARGGARVLAVDRRPIPGRPVQCAELVAEALFAACPQARSASLQNVSGLDCQVDDGPAYPAPFGGRMVDRAALDRALVDDATRAGVEIILDCAATISADGTVQLRNGEVIRPRLIIGADGPCSAAARAAGRTRSVVLHTRQIKVRLCRPTDRATTFHEPSFGGGYGWLFPRGADAWLGIGLAAGDRGRLPVVLRDLQSALVATGRIAPDVVAITGGAIPVGGPDRVTTCLGSIPVLLAGDAAGLTHPVSGAGIAAAIVSGRLAGTAASAWAGGRELSLSDYADEIADLYGSSIRRALARRAERLAGGRIKRTWIGFPDYWQGEA